MDTLPPTLDECATCWCVCRDLVEGILQPKILGFFRQCSLKASSHKSISCPYVAPRRYVRDCLQRWRSRSTAFTFLTIVSMRCPAAERMDFRGVEEDHQDWRICFLPRDESLHQRKRHSDGPTRPFTEKKLARGWFLLVMLIETRLQPHCRLAQ